MCVPVSSFFQFGYFSCFGVCVSVVALWGVISVSLLGFPFPLALSQIIIHSRWRKLQMVKFSLFLCVLVGIVWPPSRPPFPLSDGN